ncbi:MAG: hypothetical protein WCV90_05235 [Candidatus Woesearchaeota archaeon]|jgi:hypothetical protein
MVKELALFYFPRYHQYFLNGNDSLTYQHGKSVGFDTLKKALDYLIREDGKRPSILSLDEKCTQEIPEGRTEIRHDETLDQDKLYLKNTKIVIK